MKNFLIISLLLFALCCDSCKKDDKQQTQTVNLQTDGYTDAASVGFQSGFLAGEEGAVTLGPVNNTFQVTYVRFLFGGGGTTVNRDIKLKIYKDIGAATPGTLLFTSTYRMASSNTVMQEIDLRDENIVLAQGGSIRVSIEMTATGYPCIARDGDGTISETRNWVKETNGTWSTSKSFGVTGDWIIRATVEEDI
ncbi:MAG: hypothetical protein MUC78_00580 [Bacteroidales bacterium]|jgi:hypothetical protein|nr:hypothetical protein [Bacteroidales bacterium]